MVVKTSNKSVFYETASSQQSCEYFQCNEMIFNAQNELQFKLAQVCLSETEKRNSQFFKYKQSGFE